MAERRYVVGGADGWLRVKREPGGAIVALPEYLQVEVTSSTAGRDNFTALEGPEKNSRFSVKMGNLESGNPGYRPAASLQFSLSQNRLTYAGVAVSAITDVSNAVPVGTHPIQIPDFPHDLGLGYVGQSAYAKNWFYLGTGNAIPGSNDRYLHTGRVSAGCITVAPVSWTALYRHLILSRRGDGRTVGTVTVVR